tara:strand:- start:5433 stop:7691 length:2259 start_codon:yes stop_codon:yes gene_type:complete
MQGPDDIFERLNRGFYISHLGGLLGGISSMSNLGSGVHLPVMPDSESGRDFLDKILLSKKLERPQLQPVEDAWTLMRLAAGWGFDRITLLHYDSSREVSYYLNPPTNIPYSQLRIEHGNQFFFLSRPEEASSILPTVLGGNFWPPDVEDPEILYLTRTGTRSYHQGDIIGWERFDITDPLAATLMESPPFQDWEMGAPFYELVSLNPADSRSPKINRFGFLDDWGSSEGLIPLFTVTPTAQSLAELLDSKVIPIHNLQERIRQLSEKYPDKTIVINPFAARVIQGYILEGEIIHLSGSWKVLPNNQLEQSSTYRGWVRQDTVGWAGGPSLQLAPLGRSFFDVHHPEINEFNEQMTSTDAEEWLLHYFAHYTKKDQNGPTRSNFDTYSLSCWDTLTKQLSPSSFFPHFLDALAWISQYELGVDRDARVMGRALDADGNSSPYWSEWRKKQSRTDRFFDDGDGEKYLVGNQNPEWESTRGDRFQKTLVSIGVKVLTEGYSPQQSDELVFLCNRTLRSLHVDFAGYIGDILWACNEAEKPDILKTVSVNEEDWIAWTSSSIANIDPIGKSLALRRIEETTWNLLSGTTQHFVSTALASLEEFGHIPQRDYAGISIQIVKSIEVELGIIMESFKTHIQEIPSIAAGVTQDDEMLRRFVYDNGKPPTLGQIIYLFRQPAPDSPPLTLTLYDYVKSLPNGTFLTSSKLRSTLRTAIYKYRNGGAHDSSISYATCIEALESIVGQHGKPGILAEIVLWR